MRYLALLVAFLLCACVAPVTPVTPYADVAPQAVPQEFDCSITGDNAAFDMRCVVPPTPTPEPGKWAFACEGDTRCTSGQFRVYWDRDLTMLRCALGHGEQVDVITTGYSLRVGEGEDIAWVVTGLPAGAGKVCEGWTPTSFLKAAE